MQQKINAAIIREKVHKHTKRIRKEEMANNRKNERII
jgi:hypothetical protein